MRGLGILLVITGFVWTMIAFNMDTTVTTESQRYGSGAYAIDVPSVTVNNLGLMETRRNNLMFAGLTILAGVVLIGFGSIKRPNEIDTGLKPCPLCAEKIQPTAVKCRFCGSDLPDSFRTPTPITVSTPANDRRLRSLIAIIKQGTPSIRTYTEALNSLGGTLTSKGFRVGMHYIIDLDGVKSRVDRFEDLRQWFLDNVAPRVGA